MSKQMVWKPVEPAIYALPDTYYRHMLIYEDVTEGHSVSFVTSLDVTPTDELNVQLGDYRICQLVPAEPDDAGDVQMTEAIRNAIESALTVAIRDVQRFDGTSLALPDAIASYRAALAYIIELKGQGNDDTQ